MKILGIGDNVIDYYTNMGVMYPGGNALNVAVHSSILGAEAAYMGNLGEDAMAQVIKNALSQFHVDSKACITIKGSTTKRCNYKVIDGERIFLGVELGKQWSGPMVLNELELEYIGKFDVLHSSCNAKMEDEIDKLEYLPKILSYDFGEKEKYRVPEYYNKVCRNLDLALFSCNKLTESEAKDFCRQLHQIGVKHILITMGGDGQYVSNGVSIVYGEAHNIIPVDTMGAGDAFLAAFIKSMYDSGWKKGEIMNTASLKVALQKGNEYSTQNCRVEGGFGYKEEEIV
ncbi:MAG: PfkB family carbohydrate kinase [Herbinix sp.]|nr:PfkB family carbohydrate kinase [Herbinix sp.]